MWSKFLKKLVNMIYELFIWHSNTIRITDRNTYNTRSQYVYAYRAVYRLPLQSSIFLQQQLNCMQQISNTYVWHVGGEGWALLSRPYRTERQTHDVRERGGWFFSILVSGLEILQLPVTLWVRARTLKCPNFLVTGRNDDRKICPRRSFCTDLLLESSVHCHMQSSLRISRGCGT